VGEEECAVDEVVAGLVDGVAGDEVAEWPGVVDVLGDGEAVDELDDGEVVGAFELAAATEPLPAVDIDVGAPGLDIAPGPCGVEVETVATAPTGVAPPPAAGRLPRTRRPMTMTPAKTLVRITPSPRPRRLRERRTLRPFGRSAADAPARMSSRSPGPRSPDLRSPGLLSPRSAGRGTARERSPR
jgi:hypothetical protein